jgi:hypothetical protein
LAFIWRWGWRFKNSCPLSSPAAFDNIDEPDYRVPVYVEGQGVLVNGDIDLSRVPVDQFYGLELVSIIPFPDTFYTMPTLRTIFDPAID